MTGRPKTEKADTAAENPADEKTTAEKTTAEQDSGKAETGTEYLNVTAGPLVYDHAGHIVGGGEWTPPVHLDAIGQAARRNNYLLPRSAL